MFRFGTSLPELSYKYALREGKKDGERPRESAMPIRGALAPSSTFGKGEQRENNIWAIDQNNIWVIENEHDAQSAAHDVVKQLTTHGLQWINRAYDIIELRDFLLTEKDHPFLERIGAAYHRVEGGNGLCPRRYDMLAELSVGLGEFKEASEYYEKARWVRGRLRYPDDSFMGMHLQNLVSKYANLGQG